ncbi:DUF6279 family lipoprotein [Polaromonas sp. A23]|uniref:DUF6279 family lipoprotein n=1 Tax=Polaromonas sp. A23 TaxID=1944133 RepID=UPI0009D5DB2F|nr:DUF6279 family lipoprotein [Polaromonas sp. A23]OOG45383.1 hypothetical protein B0B52_04180 [Polaromonas sp. A23]
MEFPVNFRFSRPPLPAAGQGRIVLIIGVLLAAAALQACSAVKIAYGQATELAYWQLDGYFDFNAAQRPKVRDELARIHLWHRQTQLPAYIKTLEKWQPLLTHDMDEAQACSIFDEIRSRLQAISDHATPVAGALVTTLETEQLEALKRKFSKLNVEYRDDFLDGKPAALIEKRLKKAVSRAEMLYGSLEHAQRDVLKERITRSVFDARISLAEHQRRQRDALQSLSPLIAGQSTPNQAHLVIQGYFERVANSPDLVYRRYQDNLTRDSCKTFAALHNSTTAAQRAHAVKTLQRYAQDFAILAARR